MAETYISPHVVVRYYGIPRTHLSMLRRVYGVRVIPRGKRFSYCEEDVINYVFGIRPKKVTLIEKAEQWFAGTDPHCRMSERTLQNCAADLDVSRSTAYAGWIKYKKNNR